MNLKGHWSTQIFPESMAPRDWSIQISPEIHMDQWPPNPLKVLVYLGIGP